MTKLDEYAFIHWQRPTAAFWIPVNISDHILSATKPHYLQYSVICEYTLYQQPDNQTDVEFYFTTVQSYYCWHWEMCTTI